MRGHKPQAFGALQLALIAPLAFAVGWLLIVALGLQHITLIVH